MRERLHIKGAVRLKGTVRLKPDTTGATDACVASWRLTIAGVNRNEITLRHSAVFDRPRTNI